MKPLVLARTFRFEVEILDRVRPSAPESGFHRLRWEGRDLVLGRAIRLDAPSLFDELMETAGGDAVRILVRLFHPGREKRLVRSWIFESDRIEDRGVEELDASHEAIAIEAVVFRDARCTANVAPATPEPEQGGEDDSARRGRPLGD